MSPLTRGGWARLLKTGPAVAAVVAATTASTIQPVIAHDFPDPAVLAVGSIYYGYSTASSYGGKVWHVPVQRATALDGRWTEVGDAMPQLPAWVAKNGANNGNVWAPEVAARSDGSYILYFTARSAAQNVQCIGVALADSPRGPFQAPGPGPLVCRPEDVDSIDPSENVAKIAIAEIFYVGLRELLALPIAAPRIGHEDEIVECREGDGIVTNRRPMRNNG